MNGRWELLSLNLRLEKLSITAHGIMWQNNLKDVCLLGHINRFNSLPRQNLDPLEFIYQQIAESKQFTNLRSSSLIGKLSITA